MQISIPTNDDIRSAVREELAAFFTSNLFPLQPPTDDIGGIEMAAEITGKAITTIYYLTSKNRIPHFKRGKQLYFSRKDLLDWIRSGSRQTMPEKAAA